MNKDRENRVWVEPFVGGANMIDKVNGKRIGNDSHKYLVALLKALQKGWVPPTEISKENYYDIKNYPDKYTDELVGFVGFLCSFGGKWWGGYACNKKNYNYADSGSRVLTKQAKNFAGIEFICGNYLEMTIPQNSLIYCDPPYRGTTKYKDTFDSNAFWQWCRDMSKKNVVFVSEYKAPDDFICVWEGEVKTNFASQRDGATHKAVEKLFKFSPTNVD